MCRCLFYLFKKFKGLPKKRKGAGKDWSQDCVLEAGKNERGRKPVTVHVAFFCKTFTKECYMYCLKHNTTSLMMAFWWLWYLGLAFGSKSVSLMSSALEYVHNTITFNFFYGSCNHLGKYRLYISKLCISFLKAILNLFSNSL